jgi:hypothetical protein
MPADPLADAVARHRRAVEAIDTAREAAAAKVQQAKDRAERERLALADAIVAATLAGRRQRDIVEVTGYTRERVRQILRAAGVEA